MRDAYTITERSTLPSYQWQFFLFFPQIGTPILGPCSWKKRATVSDLSQNVAITSRTWFSDNDCVQAPCLHCCKCSLWKAGSLCSPRPSTHSQQLPGPGETRAGGISWQPAPPGGPDPIPERPAARGPAPALVHTRGTGLTRVALSRMRSCCRRGLFCPEQRPDKE